MKAQFTGPASPRSVLLPAHQTHPDSQCIDQPLRVQHEPRRDSQLQSPAVEMSEPLFQTPDPQLALRIPRPALEARRSRIADQRDCRVPPRRRIHLPGAGPESPDGQADATPAGARREGPVHRGTAVRHVPGHQQHSAGGGGSRRSATPSEGLRNPLCRSLRCSPGCCRVPGAVRGVAGNHSVRLQDETDETAVGVTGLR